MSLAIGYFFLLHLPRWPLGIFVLLVIIVVVHFFAPEILIQLLEQLSNIATLFSDLFTQIGEAFFKLARIFCTIWGLLFALRWRAQFAIKYVFTSTTLGVLFLSSFYLCAELTVALVNGLRSKLPALYSRLDTALCSIPVLHAWLAKVKIPQMHELPFEAELGLLILAVLMFRHHWHEFWASRRRETVPPALEELFLEFDKFRKANPTSGKDSFLETLLKKMKEVLDEKSKRDVAFSLMEEEEEVVDTKGTRKRTGFLKVTFLPNNSPLDRTLRLPVGQGGAGKAYDKKAAIYIPSVRHRIGIDLDNEICMGVTYIESLDKKKLGSILSVPVLVNSKQDAVAVVTVSSKRRLAFHEEDFEIVSLAAAIVSTLY